MTLPPDHITRQRGIDHAYSGIESGMGELIQLVAQLLQILIAQGAIVAEDATALLD